MAPPKKPVGAPTPRRDSMVRGRAANSLRGVVVVSAPPALSRSGASLAGTTRAPVESLPGGTPLLGVDSARAPLTLDSDKSKAIKLMLAPEQVAGQARLAPSATG